MVDLEISFSNVRVAANNEIDLFQESPFLYDVGYGLLTNAAALVDVFKGIEFLGALMLDDSHLD